MALKHVVKENAERRWKDVGEQFVLQSRLLSSLTRPLTLSYPLRTSPLSPQEPYERQIATGPRHQAWFSVFCHRNYLYGDATQAKHPGRAESRGKACIVTWRTRLTDSPFQQHLAVPPPRQKFLSDDDEVMLEDESGRVRLVGKIIEERKFPLVTGKIHVPDLVSSTELALRCHCGGAGR